MQNVKITQYTEQIADVAAYAKKIGFSFESSSFDVLMNKWIQYTKKRHEAIMEDRAHAIKILRTMC